MVEIFLQPRRSSRTNTRFAYGSALCEIQKADDSRRYRLFWEKAVDRGPSAADYFRVGIDVTTNRPVETQFLKSVGAVTSVY